MTAPSSAGESDATSASSAPQAAAGPGLPATPLLAQAERGRAGGAAGDGGMLGFSGAGDAAAGAAGARAAGGPATADARPNPTAEPPVAAGPPTDVSQTAETTCAIAPRIAMARWLIREPRAHTEPKPGVPPPAEPLGKAPCPLEAAAVEVVVADWGCAARGSAAPAAEAAPAAGAAAERGGRGAAAGAAAGSSAAPGTPGCADGGGVSPRHWTARDATAAAAVAAA